MLGLQSLCVVFDFIKRVSKRFFPAKKRVFNNCYFTGFEIYKNKFYHLRSMWNSISRTRCWSYVKYRKILKFGVFLTKLFCRGIRIVPAPAPITFSRTKSDYIVGDFKSQKQSAQYIIGVGQCAHVGLTRNVLTMVTRQKP